MDLIKGDFDNLLTALVWLKLIETVIVSLEKVKDGLSDCLVKLKSFRNHLFLTFETGLSQLQVNLVLTCALLRLLINLDEIVLNPLKRLL